MSLDQLNEDELLASPTESQSSEFSSDEEFSVQSSKLEPVQVHDGIIFVFLRLYGKKERIQKF